MTAASAKPGGGCVVADSLVLMLPCFWSDDRLWPCMICERGAEERRTVQTTGVAESFSSPYSHKEASHGNFSVHACFLGRRWWNLQKCH